MKQCYTLLKVIVNTIKQIEYYIEVGPTNDFIKLMKNYIQIVVSIKAKNLGT